MDRSASFSIKKEYFCAPFHRLEGTDMNGGKSRERKKSESVGTV